MMKTLKLFKDKKKTKKTLKKEKNLRKKIFQERFAQRNLNVCYLSQPDKKFLGCFVRENVILGFISYASDYQNIKLIKNANIYAKSANWTLRIISLKMCYTFWLTKPALFVKWSQIQYLTPLII